jgi:hypothetical protein
MTPFSRLIALALVAAFPVALLATDAASEPLERDECKTLEAEKQTLLTAELRAALARGPDWVKDHLHSAEDIEKVRQYLQVEEKVAFRCRTDGVRVPKPKPVPLPDRKPEPPLQVAEGEQNKVLAGAASTSLLPLRKPSLSSPAPEDATPEQEAGDADEVATSEEAASAEAAPAEATEADSKEAEPGPSQTVADSDKTAPSQTKATQ